jgi:hypothetical protein
MTLLCIFREVCVGDAFETQIVFVFLCYKRRNLERSFKRIKEAVSVTNPFYFKIV